MIDLEKEIATVSNDAIEEEQYNANVNYSCLERERRRAVAKIPYPEVEKYTTGIDYEDISDIQHKKRVNSLYRKEVDDLNQYCNDGKLFCGHLNVNGYDFYFVEGGNKPTKNINNGDRDWYLINVDDRSYDNLKRYWRYPSENDTVVLSRNVLMSNKKVEDVDVIIDKSDAQYSTITDAYLRKALVRNKGKNGVQSIIQTIQKKQDNIRSLPARDSFIVQGCAGSGKTMVLLHRLRYLLYNRDINREDYIFLVPGEEFKRFIGDSIASFNISGNNVFSYKEYYQTYVGAERKADQGKDDNELAFDSEYLERVYSKDLMRESYRKFFENIADQLELVIAFLDEKLNDAFEEEKQNLCKNIDGIKKDALETIKNESKRISTHTSAKLSDDFTSVDAFIHDVEIAYLSKKREYDEFLKGYDGISIDDNDERITTDEHLIAIKEAIDAENVAISKASFFTAISHKNKLKKLNGEYDKTFADIKDAIIKTDKEKYMRNAGNYKYVYPNVTVEDVEAILKVVRPVYDRADKLIREEKTNLNSIEDYFGAENSETIIALNKLIDYSSDIATDSEKYINDLLPSSAYLSDIATQGIKVVKAFYKNYSASDKDFIKTKTPLFMVRDEKQVATYVNSLLFNICKKTINAEFNIKMCSAYKHYWYLALYSNYLTKSMKSNVAKNIFIDEAQDLSPSEIELIEKVNTNGIRPAVNLFGDTNQVIASHSVGNWNLIKFIPKVYFLNENFRNTRQVVSYCNNKLGVNMDEIGVDMSDVSEYADLQSALRVSKSVKDSPIFIVKDDYSAGDLKLLLLSNSIANYEIFTVKAVKGLEFKEVFVFDSNMTNNEKYIAYTRALVKLNVIKDLPTLTDRNESHIMQGIEDENIEE